MEQLDPHQRPPDCIKDVYKKYQKMKPKDLDRDPDILDLPDSLDTSAKEKVRIVEEWSGNELTAAFRAFSGQDGQTYADLPRRLPVYEHADMPGRTVLLCIQFSCLPSRIIQQDAASPILAIFNMLRRANPCLTLCPYTPLESQDTSHKFWP